MSKFEAFIGEIEHVLEKLSGLRDGLKQMREESEAVEKARDTLRGRQAAEEGGGAGIAYPASCPASDPAIFACNFGESPFIAV